MIGMTDTEGWPPIVKANAPFELKRCAAHVLHTVTLWQVGGGDIAALRDVANGLRQQAERHGLTESYGDEIEWIIGDACAEVGVHYGDIRP